MKLHNRITAVLLACAAVCGVLTGCTDGSSQGDSAADGLWLGIEPAQEDEFGKVTYEDGLYLSQTVKETLPDPYKKDKKLVRKGTTDEGSFRRRMIHRR